LNAEKLVILIDFSWKNERAFCAEPNGRIPQSKTSEILPPTPAHAQKTVNLSGAYMSTGYIDLNHSIESPAMKPFERISNPREIRRKLRMNQQEFWSRIGVTQSGGSRYESGRSMPKPVRELLRLVHIEGITLDKARGADFVVVSYLKTANPRLYRTLRKAAQTKNGRKK